MTEVRVVLRRLHAGQQRMLDEAERWNVAMCGRRFGKTSLGVELAVQPALDGLPVGWFAPTYKLADEAWREIVRVLADVPGVRSQQQKRLDLATGGHIEVWSLEGGDDVGRGRKYGRAIVDEAGMMPNLIQIFNAAIRPTLADLRGDGWFLGTPKGTGDFAQLFNRGQRKEEGWASWQMPTMANPHIAPEEIAELARDLPERVYRQEILGEPLDDGDHPIGLEAIRLCIAPVSENPVVAYGLDLARSVDWTVNVGLDANGAVAFFDRWQAPWGVTRGRIVAKLGRTFAKADSTGVGDPIVEDMQRAGAVMSGVVFTAREKQNLVERLIAAIQQQRITFPEGHITAELNSLTAERMSYGIRYEAPSGMHDDCVMALALAWSAYCDLGYATPQATKARVVIPQDRSNVNWLTGAPKVRPQDVRPPIGPTKPWTAPRKGAKPMGHVEVG